MTDQKISRLQEVQIKFEEWRSTRTKSVLSDELWHEAASLVGEYSFSKVCQTLRLNSNYLKRRINQPVQKLGKGKRGLNPKSSNKNTALTRLGFVELPNPSSSEDHASQGRGIQIQLEGRLGGRVKMIVPSEDSAPWEEIFSGWLRAEEQTLRGYRA